MDSLLFTLAAGAEKVVEGVDGLDLPRNSAFNSDKDGELGIGTPSEA